MTSVLIIPEKNEGKRPLLVIEEGLKADSVDEVYVIDGWSNDDTVKFLEEQIPVLEEKYGKRVKLFYDDLRSAGKGAGMVTGIKRALAAGHDRIIFLDADITSMTSKWCDELIGGIDQYNVAMTRGYFDRSPFDAQITRHITRPLVSMFFPEGREISQPLGGELCMTGDLAHYLQDSEIAPPCTWGIDTFFIVNALIGEYRIAELYLTQKTHKKKNMDQLKTMFTECFDEAVHQVHFHKRDVAVPSDVESLLEVVPLLASEIERVGEDVRSQVYVDLDSQIESFFTSVRKLEDTGELMNELGISTEDTKLLQGLFTSDTYFKERSVELGIEEWINILDSITRGYIARRFDACYHDLLFAIWKLRTLTFCLNEAQNFEDAEENTKKQAIYAFQYGQGMTS
jgi:glycosyltransferase involved in cell wall biosynthesis